MRFEHIFKETEENVRLALESMWVPGSHPLRGQIERLFDREPLLAEPVFQSMFSWESAHDGSWRSALNPDVIEKLEIGSRFAPYEHQAQSWKALHDGKSIVVTSGTGSGKTECFMYPVIGDLCEQGRANAIQAIFLYPLNALMEDQKQRLSSYCQPNGLRFAVYNGSTPEYRADQPPLPCEVGTRDEIRDPHNQGTRPQILLTNPSMLEYILVRKKDQQMLQESAGRLRWIVIDEAHTYSGSAAAELSLQIKRILEAFGVSASDVRFACTSATMGGQDGASSLAAFISGITGQPASRIAVIDGHRVLPEIDPVKLAGRLQAEGLPEIQRVLKIRQQINTLPGMSLGNIWDTLCPETPFHPSRTPEALALLDKLCDISIDGKALLSIRAHLFMRTINGLYACANPSCSGSTGTPYGYLTTYKASVCPHCGQPLLEILQCKRCNSFILSGTSDPSTHLISPMEEELEQEDPFALEQDAVDDADSDTAGGRPEQFFLIPYNREKHFNPTSKGNVVTLDINHGLLGARLDLAEGRDGHWVEIRSDSGRPYCPDCGRLITGTKLHLQHFRVPLDFLNQIISPVFLKECAPAGQPWGKYIAFTDSRQGTAISAKTFNIEVERRCCRSYAMHQLAQLEADAADPTAGIPGFASLPLATRNAILQRLGPTAGSGSISLHELADIIYDKPLHRHLTDGEGNETAAYKASLIRQFIGRRQLYENGPETMGLITLTYPALSDVRMPEELADYSDEHQLGVTDEDWRDFLKLALDFFVRFNNHIQPLVDGERPFIRDANLSRPFTAADDRRQGIPAFPGLLKSEGGDLKPAQSRLVVLLCAGLGIRTLDELKANQTLVSHLLQEAWNELVRKRILMRVLADGRGYDDPIWYSDHRYVGCYYLDLSAREDNKVARVRRTREAWECPVSGKLLDTLFRGISPMITGELSPRLIERYRCGDPIEMPAMPSDPDQVEAWLQSDDAIRNLQAKGFWTDRFKYVYRYAPSYIAAEHSAQQSRVRLREYTEAFKKSEPEINVLQCSTTMEMGVDIGDIDIVLMDTIPPSAANYLQRAGRAGRNRQSRALAFSLCNNTPVSQQAFAKPMWALETPNQMSPATLSRTIIQRHVNSYFFRKFTCDNGQGLDATYTVGDFMSCICDSFVTFLDAMGGNSAAKQDFEKTFGPQVGFWIDRTKEHILSIKKKYEAVIAELEAALVQYQNDARRQIAIANQIKKIKNENLLTYLSEQQFIPNASMPTGVVTFDFMDQREADKLRSLYHKADQLTTRIANADTAEKIVLEQELHSVYRSIRELRAGTTSTREINIALNEYAPGQTVVVNEKNYRSAGLLLYGAYNESTQTKYLYHCANCGKIEYLDTMDESKRCPRCNAPYRSIIDGRNDSFTQAYEPVGFRTDQGEKSSREERTEKRYYDIRPILLTVEWSRHTDINMCQIAGSGENGRILYYNCGDRYGFAFCKRCGRAVVETDLSSADPPSSLPLTHRRLLGDPCDASQKSDIARHVVFTGSHYTCYSVLRFQADPKGQAFVTDKTLVFSLGVILKRALVEYLGIEASEISFGIKQEADAFLLFIYDTARGGCGYSTHLTNPAECQAVFDIALRMLGDYSCKCHEDGGACTRCLVDRDNYREAEFLSKGAAMEWLAMQKERAIEVPAAIKVSHPDAAVIYHPLKGVAMQAISQQETSSISFFVSDLGGDCTLSEWTSIHSEMGRLIRKAIERGKEVTLLVEYHPELHTSLVDRLPYIGLQRMFPDCTVKFISDMGTLKTALVTHSASHAQHFFTDQRDALPFSDEWGSACNRLFADGRVPAYQEIPAPSYPLQAAEVIRQGMASVTQFPVGKYFSKVIAPCTLQGGDLNTLKGMLQGQRVDLSFSDMYVNSALASLMLVHLIKEMRDLFGFSIRSLTLQLDSPKRRCISPGFTSYSFINYNFPCAQEADSYTDDLCLNELGIQPVHSSQDANHHRWLRIQLPDGRKVEIRPDHGISGGYRSLETYMDRDYLDEQTLVYRNNEDVLYYVIIKTA